MTTIPLRPLDTTASLPTDGTLSLSLNLCPDRNGRLRPVLPPLPIMTLPAGARLIHIHRPAPEITHYLITDGAGLYYRTAPTGDDITILSSPVTTVSVIGNVLIAAPTDGPLQYILYNPDTRTYSRLGDVPPFITIQFGCKQLTPISETFKADIPYTCLYQPNADIRLRYTPSETDRRTLTNILYSHILPHITDINNKGHFHSPFFVRCAYRLYDGTHRWHSSPVLMLPTVLPPLLQPTTYPNSDSGTAAVENRLSIEHFELTHHIDSRVLDQLKDWTDIITHIDIYISAPVYTFDQAEEISDPVVLYRSSLLFAGTGVVTVPSGTSFLHGQYCAADANSYTEHAVPDLNNVSNTPCWNLRRPDSFTERLRDTSVFYRYASIPISELKATTSPVPLPASQLYRLDLNDIATRPTLSDDTNSRSLIGASILYPYNSRLFAAGITRYPAPAPALLSSLPYISDQHGALLAIHTRISASAVRTPLRAGNVTYDKVSSTVPPRYIFSPDPSAHAIDIDNRSYPLTEHSLLNGTYYFDPSLFTPSPNTPPYDADLYQDRRLRTPDFIQQPNRLISTPVDNPFHLTYSNTAGDGHIISIATAHRALSQGQFGQYPLYIFTSRGIWAASVNNTGTIATLTPISADIVTSPNAVTSTEAGVIIITPRGIRLLEGSMLQPLSASVYDSDTNNELKLPPVPQLSDICHLAGLPDITQYPHPIGSDSCLAYDYTRSRLWVLRPGSPLALLYDFTSSSWGHVILPQGAPSAHLIFHSSLSAWPDTLLVTCTDINEEDDTGEVEAPAPLTTVLSLSQTLNTLPIPVLFSTHPLTLSDPYSLKTIRSLSLRLFPYAQPHTTALSLALYGQRNTLTRLPPYNAPITSAAAASANRATLLRTCAPTHRPALHTFSSSPYTGFTLLAFGHIDPVLAISHLDLDFIDTRSNHRPH